MTPGQGDYVDLSTTRNNDQTVHTIHDEKDDLHSLKAQVQRRKKPIFAGLAILVVVLIGVSIGVATNTKSTANTESVQDTVTPSFRDVKDGFNTSDAKTDKVVAPVKADPTTTVNNAGKSSRINNPVEEVSSTDANIAGQISTTKSEVAGEASAGQNWSMNASLTVTPRPTTETAMQTSTGKALSYSIVDFDWTDASKWEYASGATVPSSMVTSSGITLTPDNSAEPIRTKEGWSGEKVVYIEWERSSTSDTNIWMLNTKLQDQFKKGNGWPYWGELDLFEMFTQDAMSNHAYDFSGFGGFTDVSSYGQLTMHMGPAHEDGSPCFCPASPTKSQWYESTQPMTSGCTAQFSNDASNSIAAVWGTDSTGKYIQLFQHPVLTRGGKLNDVDTYDVAAGRGGATSKIYNNANLFWGVDATASCAKAGGHDATSGFPFFESFRLVLEEQKKGDSSASFTVKNIQIFTKN